MNNLEQKINKLRALKQYKNKTDEELEQIVLEKIRQEEIENVLLDFEDKHEKEYAKKLMDKYLSEYEFENSSEKDTLAHLIYCEVTIKRIKELMNIQKKESNGAVPQQLSVELRDYMNQVIDIKEKLGMNKKKEENSPLKTWMDLKEKALDWAKTHEAETTLKCVSEGTKILMSDMTVKNIEDVNEGDEIIAFKENSYTRIKKAKVLKKTYSGIRKVLEINNGENSLFLTPDHPILVKYKGHWERNWQNVGNEINLLELKSKHKIPYFKNLIGNIDNYYRGVLLGIIKSDGNEYLKKHEKWNFKKRFSIWQSKSKEYKAIEFILNRLNIKYYRHEEFGNRSGYNKNYEGYSYIISVESTDYIEKIKVDLENDKDVKLGFITGFIIGDGNIYKSIITIAQKEGDKSKLIEDVIISLGIKYNKWKNNKNNMITYRLYNGTLPLHCPESIKCKKYVEGLTTCITYYSDEGNFTLESIQEKPTWDITTTEGTFIANGFFVHNCPYCQNIVRVLANIENKTPHKLTFFKGTTVYNYDLFKAYHEKKLSKEEVAKILGVSVYYIEYIYDNDFLKELHDNENERKD